MKALPLHASSYRTASLHGALLAGCGTVGSLMLGCSASSAHSTAVDDGGIVMETGSPTDASDGGAVARDASDGASPAAAVIGWVYASTLDDIFPGSDLEAWFGAPGAVPFFLGGPCKGTMTGACCVGSMPGTPSPSLSAGTIQVGGNALPPMPEDGGVAYHSTTGSWGQNTDLMVAASGDAVKAFAGTVYSPSAPTPISPAPPTTSTTKISIPRSADFVVTWQKAGSQAGILVTVQYAATMIQCLAPDSAGTITVPASLLAPIPTGATGNALSLTAIATSQADAGGEAVDLACWASVAWLFD